MSSFSDVISLVRRWSNGRDGRTGAPLSRRGKKTRAKRREKAERHDFETAGAIFSVKFIGVYAVDNAFDESGCHRALSKRERRRRRRMDGQRRSPHVLLSLTSTTIKIIQHHWVAFEQEVTAVSTCYADRQRPRLFAYIVKDYQSGHHFCMAFKTLKRSNLTGERLQVVFGYAFDSCGSPSRLLLSADSEESSGGGESTTTELERCLQICNYSYHVMMRSNSNFSATSETIEETPFVRSKSYRLSSVPQYHHHRMRRKQVAIEKNDSSSSICSYDKMDGLTYRTRHQASSPPTITKHQRKLPSMQNRTENQTRIISDAVKACKKGLPPTISTRGNEEKQEEDEKEKNRQPIKTGLNRCFFCQHQRELVTLDHSISDSYLHCKYQPLQLKPIVASGFRNTSICIPEQGTGESRNHVNKTQESEPIPDDGAVSLQSLAEEKKRNSHEIVVLLASPLHDENSDDGTKEGNEKPDCVMTDVPNPVEGSEWIERQVAYVNLPTQDSGSAELAVSPSPPPVIAKQIGLRIASSEIPTGSAEVDTFISKAFVTDLTLKLTQLANSIDNQPPGRQLHLLHLPSKVSYEPVPTLLTSGQPASSKLLESSSDLEQLKLKDVDSIHNRQKATDLHNAAVVGNGSGNTECLILESANASSPHASPTNSDESFICINGSLASTHTDNNPTQSEINPTSTNGSTPIQPQPTRNPPSANDSTTHSNAPPAETNGPPPASGSPVENSDSVTIPRVLGGPGETPVNVGSSCSNCQATHEAQRQLSQVLALLASPQPASGSAGEGRAVSGNGEGSRSKIVCLIATWDSTM